MKRFCGVMCVALATVVGAYPLGTASAQKAVEKTEEEKSGELVERLGIAAQLTAFGRGELSDITGVKEFKSADALVAAGAIYLRAHKETAGKTKAADFKVDDEDGKPVKDAPVAATSYADEAEALFDEARSIAKDKAGIEAQIKQAKLVPERGAVGGPRQINRVIPSGKTHTIHIPFAPGQPAHVSMRGTGKTQFEVIGPGGKVLWHSKGSWGYYNWHTGQGGLKDVTVKVINKGGPGVAYQVTTN